MSINELVSKCPKANVRGKMSGTVSQKRDRNYSLRSAGIKMHNFVSGQDPIAESVFPCSTEIELDEDIMETTFAIRARLGEYFFRNPTSTGDCFGSLMDCLEVLNEDQQYLREQLASKISTKSGKPTSKPELDSIVETGLIFPADDVTKKAHGLVNRIAKLLKPLSCN